MQTEDGGRQTADGEWQAANGRRPKPESEAASMMLL
jgi:hypothetical protein